ncbi:MAG: AAA family ATPase [Candidatus Obscuribacterales bacterium]
MWVERVELTGYGGIQGESVLFAQEKLNLMVEPNEYGKSTMATAIWSILFDFNDEKQALGQETVDHLSQREARKPKSGATYSARMDVSALDRRLTIVRDFQSKTFQVFDRDRNNVEVTHQFKSASGEDEIGLKLTGMTRELFLSTCFVGQRELDEHAFGGAQDLATLVQGIADSASPSGTSAQAVRMLGDTLNQLPVGNRKVKADNLIRDLELVRQDLLNKIRAFERDRQDVAASFDRLMIINRVLSGDSSRFKATEYQNLKFQLNDAQGRLNKLREILNRHKEASVRISQLSAVEAFPPDLKRPIEDLLERRAHKAGEIERITLELSPQQGLYEEKKASLISRSKGLDTFSLDEIQQVASIAGTMSVIEEEINDLKARRKSEREKLAGAEASEAEIDEVRKSMQSLEAEGIENARSYNSLILAFQDQITNGERALHQSRAKHKEFEVKRKQEGEKKRNLAIVLGLTSIIMAVLAVVLMITVKQAAFIAPVLLLLGILGMAGTAFIAVPVFKPEVMYASDFQSIEADKLRIINDLEEKHNTVGALELKLDTLARKVGLAARADLLTRLDQYAVQASKLKELDLIDQLLDQKQATLSKFKADLTVFVNKVGKPNAQLTANTAKQLSQGLSAYTEEAKILEQTFQDANSTSRKLSQLKEELEDTDQALGNILQKVGMELDLSSAGAIARGLEEISERINSHSAYAKLADELTSLENESGTPIAELPTVVKGLEDYQTRVIQQLDALRSQHPGIEAMPPISEEETEGEEAPQDLAKVEGLKEEREELLQRVRTLSGNCDEQYLSCLEELDLTEFKLHSAKRAKVALEIARDSLKRLSGENYIDWATNLNNIGKEMLSKLGLDYEEVRFDPELRLVARRKNQKEDISSAEIMNQLSIGTKEQLHWLARMIVARFLSRQNALPIIMDEPFSEADDDRFLKMMRFLINVIAKEHQIILFSCHQQRHSWLRSQLDDPEKGRLLFCRRSKS